MRQSVKRSSAVSIGADKWVYGAFDSSDGLIVMGSFNAVMDRVRGVLRSQNSVRIEVITKDFDVDFLNYMREKKNIDANGIDIEEGEED